VGIWRSQLWQAFAKNPLTVMRAGVPEKYSREVTDYYWDRLDCVLPDLEELADLFDADPHR